MATVGVKGFINIFIWRHISIPNIGVKHLHALVHGCASRDKTAKW